MMKILLRNINVRQHSSDWAQIDFWL